MTVLQDLRRRVQEAPGGLPRREPQGVGRLQPGQETAGHCPLQHGPLPDVVDRRLGSRNALGRSELNESFLRCCASALKRAEEAPRLARLPARTTWASSCRTTAATTPDDPSTARTAARSRARLQRRSPRRRTNGKRPRGPR